MDSVHLDTHAVIWLFNPELKKLSSKAIELIEKNTCAISPVVELELQFLFEINRITLPASEIVGRLTRQVGLRRSEVQISDLVSSAKELTWTRDPFDRLIVADAICSSSQLISKDQVIRQNCDLAVW